MLRGHQTIALWAPSTAQGPNPALAQGTAFCHSELLCHTALDAHPSLPLCLSFPAPKTLQDFPFPHSFTLWVLELADLHMLEGSAVFPHPDLGFCQISIPKLWVVPRFHAQILASAVFPCANFGF